MTSEACVGLLLVELHFPDNRSLKGKRGPISSLRDTVQRRFRASFSEVAHLDSWQRAEVLIAVAASSVTQARERIEEIDRYVHGREFEVARVLLKTADPVGALWRDDS